MTDRPDDLSLADALEAAQKERDELKRWAQQMTDALDGRPIPYPDASPYRVQILAARVRQLEEALQPLLRAAEDECAGKVRSPDKNAEYWAAQEVGRSMPGVDRRIKLARAVIAAREVLAAKENTTP